MPNRMMRAIINISAVKNNIQTIRSRMRPDCKFMAVVKADAYGHGAVEISKAALEAGAEYLGVAIAEEGAALRATGIDAPILVLGGMPVSTVPLVIENDLTQTVFSCETIEALQTVAAAHNKVCKIHIKVDTGMARIGIRTLQELEEMFALLLKCPNIELEGMFTHFAVSEIPDKSYTKMQFEKFKDYVTLAQEKGYSPMLHCCNSGAILDLADEMQLSMVRGGIAMYGYSPEEGCGSWAALRPVMSLKTVVVLVKEIEAGETVSYGRKYTAPEKRTIATLSAGYGDGYKRTMSGKAEVLIHGHRAPVVGTICMDQCMADVTDIPGVKVGDEVVLMGAQGDNCITADELAAWADTISYEILLSLTGRVPRVYETER